MEEKIKKWKPEGNTGDGEMGERMEIDRDEPASSRFLAALAKPNSYRNFQQGLNEENEWDITYNSCDDDDVEYEIDIEANDEREPTGNVIMYNALTRIHKRFESYCKELPVIGFNSSNYDLNLVKTRLAKALNLFEGKDNFIVKKNNSYMCIGTDTFKFLDITQYLAPGSSYSKFLKAYEVTETKSYFPYCWFDAPEKLDYGNLPPYQAFFSDLKNVNTLEEEFTAWEKDGHRGLPPENGEAKYRNLQQIWKDENMKSMKDFLIHYNNLDVKPFVSAVKNFQKFYRQKQLDVFKISLSIPGIARKMLFKAGQESGALFQLFRKEDEDLHMTVKQNICGGPSIIFNRFHRADETGIRRDDGKICKRILGLDANSLYLHAIGRDMPHGSYCRLDNKNGNLIPTNRHPKHRSMYLWMDFVAKTDNIKIKHKWNSNRETRIGPYLIDGMDTDNRHIYEVNIHNKNK